MNDFMERQVMDDKEHVECAINDSKDDNSNLQCIKISSLIVQTWKALKSPQLKFSTC